MMHLNRHACFFSLGACSLRECLPYPQRRTHHFLAKNYLPARLSPAHDKAWV